MIRQQISSRPVLWTFLLLLGTAPASAQQSPCLQAETELAAGRRQHAQHNYQAAIGDFRHALKLCPENHQALLETVQSELAAQQPAAAEKDARQYMKLESTSETGQFFLAYSLYQQHRYPDSARAATALIHLAPRNPNGYVLLGMDEYFLNNFPQSEHALKDGLKLQPQNQEALYFLALAQMGRDDYTKATGTLRQLLESDPKSFQARDKLALCEQRLGKFEAAAADFRKSEQFAPPSQPGSDAPFADHAAMLLDRKQPDQAIPLCREAVSRNPHSATNEFFLGRALFEAGKPEEAVPPLEQAVAISPDNRKAHFLLAKAEQQLGHKDAADREFAVVRQLEAQENAGAAGKESPHAVPQGPPM